MTASTTTGTEDGGRARLPAAASRRRETSQHGPGSGVKHPPASSSAGLALRGRRASGAAARRVQFSMVFAPLLVPPRWPPCIRISAKKLLAHHRPRRARGRGHPLPGRAPSGAGPRPCRRGPRRAALAGRARHAGRAEFEAYLLDHYRISVGGSDATQAARLAGKLVELRPDVLEPDTFGVQQWIAASLTFREPTRRADLLIGEPHLPGRGPNHSDLCTVHFNDEPPGGRRIYRPARRWYYRPAPKGDEGTGRA